MDHYRLPTCAQLGGAKNSLRQLVHALNRLLIRWAAGATGNSVDVGIHFTQHFKHNFCSELIPIVCMEYLWIANDPKDFLQIVRNEVRMLPGQSTQISESCGVIFDGHDPTHKNTKGIHLP